MMRFSLVFLFFLYVTGIAILSPAFGQSDARLLSGVVKITSEYDGKRRVGSGIVIRLEKDLAYIVTASHVIEGDPQPLVEFFTKRNRPVPAKVIGMEGGDPRGLASLVVDQDLPADLQVLSFDQSVLVRPGDPVTMIGFPRMVGAPWAITKGEMVGREGKDLVFSGPVDEGNSGGPLLKDQTVIGIVTEASPPFAYASPAVIARYVLESWGVQFGIQLRAQPATISPISLKHMLRAKGIHHPYNASEEDLSPGLIGTFQHSYTTVTRKNASLIIDRATHLMWQQTGSPERIRGGVDQDGPQLYIDQLNVQHVGGFSDWRLPTVEELASLLESIGSNDGLFIDTVFDSTQWSCWSADSLIKTQQISNVVANGPWELYVDFHEGRINYRRYRAGNTMDAFVRGVRTILPSDPPLSN
jgi:hypothetical protein